VAFPECARFAPDGSVRAREAMAAPAAGDVIVAVAGIALGSEPDAEISGTVVAAGESAREWIDRRVVVPRHLPCGDCDRCRRGQVASCAQRRERRGFATHETVPARWLCSVEPPLWPEHEELWRLAALADAAAGPWAALARAGVGPGDTVIVVGGHARASFAAAIAAAKGARVILDGATAGDAATPAAPATAIERAVVIETRGDDASRKRALELAAIGARFAFLDGAAANEPIAVDVARLVRDDAQLTMVNGAHPDLLPELVVMVTRKQLPLAPHVHAVTLAEAAAARKAWLAGESATLPIVKL
jgi:threonine dehydrogenase-like Zn-dependent dehydrogenase